MRVRRLGFGASGFISDFVVAIDGRWIAARRFIIIIVLFRRLLTKDDLELSFPAVQPVRCVVCGINTTGKHFLRATYKLSQISK